VAAGISLPIMKTQRKQQRSINSISTGRWTAYMAAAAASTFAGVGSAEAEIHYSGNVSVELTGDAVASLPLSNGASLVFQNIYQSTAEQTFTLLLKGAISGSARGDGFYVSNLPPRKNVSAGRFFSVAGNPNHGVLIQTSLYGPFSPFFGPNRGFVGFRFNVGNGTQYGWARIYTKLDGNRHVHDVIRDYAWGDVGDAISTGQKQSLQPANANSVPGSLGLLAFGAQGLDAWRTQWTQKSADFVTRLH
jgi:hypothetical protein